ncbi:MAG: Lrp/AsnC ligand binding domain-containing protein [Candidatus Bathyarchaeia archaeon]|nr:Lrp/AsnC ligand binding domain-containing protein [Candidatus Bathyarchaeota archaeon]
MRIQETEKLNGDSSKNIILGINLLTAFVFIRVEMDAVSRVASQIMKIEGVEEAYEVTGDIDVIAKISARNMDDLTKIIFRIREIEGVQGTDTRIVLVSHLR